MNRIKKLKLWWFRLGKWKCLECSEYYKPSKGEIMRLHYWGVSGEPDNHVCRGLTNEPIR
jgi:hypothetical protein